MTATITAPTEPRPASTEPGRVPAPEPPPQLSPRLQLVRAVLVVVLLFSTMLLVQLVVLSARQHSAAQAGQFDRFRSRLATGTAPTGPLGADGHELAIGTPVAYLEIPKIGVDEVVGEGTTPGGMFDGPGHRRDTPLPGQIGSSVIYGRRAAFGGPFSDIDELLAGDRITVTTAQGTFQYRVIGVRHEGDPLPAAVAPQSSRLLLATAAGTPFIPNGVVRVDADLDGPAVVGPARVRSVAELTPAERLMASDPRTLWALAMWLQAVLVVSLAAVWTWHRWGRAQTWVVFLPLVVLVGLFHLGGGRPTPPQPDVTDEEQDIVSTEQANPVAGVNHDGRRAEVELVSCLGAVVQVVSGRAGDAEAIVVAVDQATITLTDLRLTATIDDDPSRTWVLADVREVVHGSAQPWTILVDADASDLGVTVPLDRVDQFRTLLQELHVDARHQARPPDAPALRTTSTSASGALPVRQFWQRRGRRAPRKRLDQPAPARPLAGIDARNVSAWFGSHQVLDRVSLEMRAGEVTALIGPSGCGKSTFLRILNRMHEMIPAAAMAGEVLVNGHDIYHPARKLTDARREVGMVFQKPNPFPAMSIYDNVLASLRLTGVKANNAAKDDLVESCLGKAGLWLEVRDRLRQPGGGLSGGQQQRLCIARALAIQPSVLLMDEPCSALDPTSTRRIEETIMELVAEVTIVIVTHNMQQAARVSDRCAFFLAEQGTPGFIVEHGPTTAMFGSPQDPRTNDYVNGRFG